jgi:hypothetical protein
LVSGEMPMGFDSLISVPLDGEAAVMSLCGTLPQGSERGATVRSVSPASLPRFKSETPQPPSAVVDRQSEFSAVETPLRSRNSDDPQAKTLNSGFFSSRRLEDELQTNDDSAKASSFAVDSTAFPAGPSSSGTLRLRIATFREM